MCCSRVLLHCCTLVADAVYADAACFFTCAVAVGVDAVYVDASCVVKCSRMLV